MQPIPTQIFLGISLVISTLILLLIKIIPSTFLLLIFTFSGKITDISLFCRIREVTFLALSKLSNLHFKFSAKVSTAIFPETSVAVVITGMLFKISDISLLLLFAPPKWPDNKGITKFPCSSIEITAGSISFFEI